MARWTLWSLLIACYRPEPPSGAPCGAMDACPSGLRCVGGSCVAGPPGDASGDDSLRDAPVDGAIDTIPPDAQDITIGCADGERDALTDRDEFPAIAGCAASWVGSLDLRAAATGTACGDALGTCSAPADACAPGWRLCGATGAPTELVTRLTAAQCTELVGRYVAAMSHCSGFDTECLYTTPFGCLSSGYCSEPVCCGAACLAYQGCRDGVYLADTWIAGSATNGCGAMLADVTGVLCCR